jgi:TolB protein
VLEPAAAAFPGGNGRISFDSFRDGPDPDVWTVNPDGSDPVNLTAGSPGADFAAAWSPDGRRIVFLHNDDVQGEPATANEIWVMDAGGSHPRRITNNAEEIYVMRSDGSQETPLSLDPAFDGGPDWQPIGRHDDKDHDHRH